jgi:glycosyltransferase involved in cell wall biosynthesis
MIVWLVQRAEPTPHDASGRQRRLRTALMADHFHAAGHDVVWWTSTFDHYSRRHRFPCDQRAPVKPGYDIYYLHGPGYRKNVSIGRLVDERRLARRFSVRAEELPPPDLIICSLPSVPMARAAKSYASSRGIPIVSDVRDLWPDAFADVLPQPLRLLSKPVIALLRRGVGEVVDASAAVIGLTDEFLDWAFRISSRPRGQHDRPLAMAYDPSDKIVLSDAEKTVCHAKFAIDPSVLNVFFVGATGPMMALTPVLDAARILEQRKAPVHIRICGDGSLLSALRAQAGTCATLSLPGWIDAREINFLLSQSQVGLLPYIATDAFKWSLPNKFGEYLSGGLALACGLPDSAMARLIEAREIGFSYRDAESLADELQVLSQDRTRLAPLRENAARTFEEMFHGPRTYSSFVRDAERLVGTADRSQDETIG